MYRGSSKYFKVVYNSEKQFSIWHAEAPKWPTWKDTGRFGSENECWDFIETRQDPQGFLFRFPSGD